MIKFILIAIILLLIILFYVVLPIWAKRIVRRKHMITTKQKIKWWAISITITAGLLAGALWYAHEPQLGVSPEQTLKVDKGQILESREIDHIKYKEDGTFENKGKIISYDYISGVEVPAEKDEDISRRTGNAKLFKKGDTFLGADEELLQEWEGKFYPGTPFVKQNDKWYQTETATTSIDAFEKQTKLSLLDRLKGYFARSAIATESGAIYSGGGDGQSHGSTAAWNTVHDDTSGASFYADTAANIAYVNTDYVVTRGFIPIDTSAITAGNVVTAGTLSIYFETVTDGDNDAQGYVSLVESSQASETALVNNDYDNCGATDDPDQGATGLDLTNMTASAHNVFTLNATGYGFVKADGDTANCGSTAGWTCFGVRMGHDIEDEVPVGTVLLRARFSNYTGTGSDPVLNVTFSEPVSVVEQPQGEPTIMMVE